MNLFSPQPNSRPHEDKPHPTHAGYPSVNSSMGFAHDDVQCLPQSGYSQVRHIGVFVYMDPKQLAGQRDS